MEDRPIEMNLSSDEAYLIRRMRKDERLRRAIFGWFNSWEEGTMTEEMVSRYGESYE